MATTAAPWSMPYPIGSDRVMDGDDVIHALADQVHAKLNESLSGVPSSGSPTAGSGWSGTTTCNMRSGWIHVRVAVTKAGSWAADETTANIPAGYRPAADLYFSVFHTGTGVSAMVGVLASGAVVVKNAHGAGATLLGTVSYPKP